MQISRDKVWEMRQLPVHPSQLTFRGRYSHVDQRLADLLELSKHQGATIRVLDVGCGVLSFGSPTLHDLCDLLVEHQIQMYVFGIDRDIPPDFDPTYPHIKYMRSLDDLYMEPLDDIEGNFDLIRILHMVEHVRDEDYRTLRRRALRLLRPGGIFVATQRLEHYKPLPKDDWYLLNPAIKIAQMTSGGIRAVELLPEISIPYWSRGGLVGADSRTLELYDKHRQDIAEGKESIPLELELRGHEQILRYLPRLKLNTLDYESIRDSDKFFPSNLLADRVHQLHEYFLDPATVAKNFWRE